MSRNAYEDEKRRERDAAYEAQRIERARLEHEREQKFGALRDRLEELGTDPGPLVGLGLTRFDGHPEAFTRGVPYAQKSPTLFP